MSVDMVKSEIVWDKNIETAKLKLKLKLKCKKPKCSKLFYKKQKQAWKIGHFLKAL